jgi:hypothetical protein
MLSSAYRSARATLLIVAGLLGSREALAQDAGAAAALFEEGLADMTAGRLAVGCPKLAESYRLDSRPGAVFTLAECEARWGKLASALAHYEDYLRLFDAMPDSQKTAQRERAAVAAQQRTSLKERTPKLKLLMPATAPKGTVVRKDGVLLGAPSIGVAVPIDPGTHRITTQAPGGAAKEHVVEIVEGQAAVVDLQVLPVAVPQSTGKAIPTAPAVVTSGSRLPWAVAAFGISAAGLGTGIATGLMALGTKDEIKANCVGTVCSQEGKDAADEGQALGWASTVAFGVSFASAGAGTVLLVTEPKETEAVRAAQVRPKVSFKKGGAQVSVAGNF